MQEAADFVISIVSQNETLLSNLSDDIKISASHNNMLDKNGILNRKESENRISAVDTLTNQSIQ